MLRRFFRWVKRHIIIILLILAVLSVASYFIYQKVAEDSNRLAFQSAQHAIDSIYADIVTRVGKPENHKVTNDCTRTYQEFTGYGSPTCHTDTSFIYGVANETEAKNLFKRIQKIINSAVEMFEIIRPPAISITDTFVVNSYYHAASDRYKVAGLDCVVNYIYDTPREIDLTIKDQTKKSFEVTIGCFGAARRAYYPLAQ